MPRRSPRSARPCHAQSISLRGETYARLVAEAERLGSYSGPSALAQQWLEEALERDNPNPRQVHLTTHATKLQPTPIKNPPSQMSKIPMGGYFEF